MAQPHNNTDAVLFLQFNNTFSRPFVQNCMQGVRPERLILSRLWSWNNARATADSMPTCSRKWSWHHHQSATAILKTRRPNIHCRDAHFCRRQELMFVANGSPVTRQTLRQRGGTGEDGHIYLAGWTLSVAAINKKKNYLTSKNEFRFFFFPPLFATLRDYPHTHTYTHTHTHTHTRTHTHTHTHTHAHTKCTGAIKRRCCARRMPIGQQLLIVLYFTFKC